MLKPVAFGAAVGITWSLGVMFLGIIAMYGWGSPIVAMLGSAYRGYASTPAGIITGGVWSLVDGFIGGYVLAWIYNALNR